MSDIFRIWLICVSLLALLYILRKIRYSKLQIEYAVFWIFCSIMLVIISIFPGLVYKFCELLGMMSPAHAVYLVFIAILLLKVFMMTIELSQLENKVKELVQKIALDEKEMEQETSDIEDNCKKESKKE